MQVTSASNPKRFTISYCSLCVCVGGVKSLFQFIKSYPNHVNTFDWIQESTIVNIWIPWIKIGGTKRISVLCVISGVDIKATASSPVFKNKFWCTMPQRPHESSTEIRRIHNTHPICCKRSVLFKLAASQWLHFHGQARLYEYIAAL